MANIIDMPKLSDTMTVGTLVKWLKKEGDPVVTGDMLAEVETDKAAMELESFFDGVLLKIIAPAGSQVPIGSPLCIVGIPGESVGTQSSMHPAEAAASGRVPAKSAAADAAGPSAAGQPASNAQSAEVPSGPSGRIRISPLARKLAETKGVDISRVAGSGPNGRIVRADVEATAAASAEAIAAKPTPAVPAGVVPAKLASASVAGLPISNPPSTEGLTPVSTLRALIARRLLESKTQIPHFYLEIEVDAEPMLTLRAQLNASLEKDGVKLSVNDFVIKAAAESLRRVAAVNRSWVEPKGGQPAIRQHSSSHVSFAVAIEDGLITPVIRDAQSKSVMTISKETKSLAKLAKEKKLQPAQYTGGTFCVTNLGMFGIERFSAIINPPDAAILAVGATVKKPVVKDDKIVIGQRMALTLSCDHRVVDGATGALFLNAVKELLEKPVMFML